MRRVVLCNEYVNGIFRHVDARIENGCLEIEGEDLGSGVPGGYGEYEYFYSFDEQQTKKLATLLTGDTGKADALLDALAEQFSGASWKAEFFGFVDKHKLEYRKSG